MESIVVTARFSEESSISDEGRCVKLSVLLIRRFLIAGTRLKRAERDLGLELWKTSSSLEGTSVRE